MLTVELKPLFMWICALILLAAFSTLCHVTKFARILTMFLFLSDFGATYFDNFFSHLVLFTYTLCHTDQLFLHFYVFCVQKIYLGK